MSVLWSPHVSFLKVLNPNNVIVISSGVIWDEAWRQDLFKTRPALKLRKRDLKGQGESNHAL